MSMSYDANGSPVDDGPDHTTFPHPPREQWSGLKSMVKGFEVLGTTPFPAHLCVVPDPREKNVTNSTEADYHIVVLVDGRFPTMGSIQVMRPYTARDLDNGEILYGWLDRSGNFVSHGERPVYEPDHAKVVAWKPCPKDFDLRA